MSLRNFILLVLVIAILLAIPFGLHRIYNINFPIDVNIFTSYGAIIAGLGTIGSSFLLYKNLRDQNAQFKDHNTQFEKQQFLSSFSQLMQMFFYTLDSLTSNYYDDSTGRKLFLIYSWDLKKIRRGPTKVTYNSAKNNQHSIKQFTNIKDYINDNSSELGLFINIFENMLDVIDQSTIGDKDKIYYARIFYSHLAPAEKEIINEICTEIEYKKINLLLERLKLK